MKEPLIFTSSSKLIFSSRNLHLSRRKLFLVSTMLFWRLRSKKCFQKTLEIISSLSDSSYKQYDEALSFDYESVARRAFLRKYIRIIKIQNSTTLKQYYLLVCILRSIVSVYTQNLTLTLSFFHDMFNNLVKCGAIWNIRDVSHFFCYIFYTLHICAVRFSELLHVLRMQT